MYYYILYNHKFISDIPLFNIPVTERCFSDPEITIQKGICEHQQYLEDESYFFLADQIAVIKAVCGFLKIKSGKEIIYELNPGYDPESITPFIMGWGMTIALSQMGYSAFHCSALTRNNQCFFVSGVSGAGKSTTSLELIKQGCKYLCDDMAIVESFENMMIPPAFPIQKVCPDVSLNLDSSNLYAISNDRNKYSYLNLSDYCDTPKPLSIFFQLLLSDEDDVKIKEITGVQKYYKVMENLFLEIQYALTSFPDNIKFQCLKIASNIKFFIISRPKGKNTLNEITNIILNILDNNKETESCPPSGE